MVPLTAEAPLHRRPPELVLLDPDDTGWANLGLWRADTRTYPEAARALASWVGGHARLDAAKRVAELGCGAGAAFGVWRGAAPDAEIIGYEIDDAAAGRTRMRAPNVRVVVAPASRVRVERDLDAIVAVDAAYHFDHRTLFDDVASALRIGGAFVWTDFVRDDALGATTRLVVRAAAPLFRFGRAAPLARTALRRALDRAGLELEIDEDLSAPVLTGFADHVDRLHAGRRDGALKLRITSAACRWAPSRGLRYVGLAARRIR